MSNKFKRAFYLPELPQVQREAKRASKREDKLVSVNEMLRRLVRIALLKIKGESAWKN